MKKTSKKKYKYNRKAKRYFDPRTGRFIATPKSVLRRRQRRAERRKLKLKSIKGLHYNPDTDRFYDGETGRFVPREKGMGSETARKEWELYNRQSSESYLALKGLSKTQIIGDSDMRRVVPFSEVTKRKPYSTNYGFFYKDKRDLKRSSSNVTLYIETRDIFSDELYYMEFDWHIKVKKTPEQWRKYIEESVLERLEKHVMPKLLSRYHKPREISRFIGFEFSRPRKYNKNRRSK